MLCGTGHKNTHIGCPKQNQATQIMHMVQDGHRTTVPVLPRLVQSKIFECFETPFLPTSKLIIFMTCLATSTKISSLESQAHFASISLSTVSPGRRGAGKEELRG